MHSVHKSMYHCVPLKHMYTHIITHIYVPFACTWYIWCCIVVKLNRINCTFLCYLNVHYMYSTIGHGFCSCTFSLQHSFRSQLSPTGKCPNWKWTRNFAVEKKGEGVIFFSEDKTIFLHKNSFFLGLGHILLKFSH